MIQTRQGAYPSCVHCMSCMMVDSSMLSYHLPDQEGHNAQVPCKVKDNKRISSQNTEEQQATASELMWQGGLIAWHEYYVPLRDQVLAYALQRHSFHKASLTGYVREENRHHLRVRVKHQAKFAQTRLHPFHLKALLACLCGKAILSGIRHIVLTATVCNHVPVILYSF